MVFPAPHTHLAVHGNLPGGPVWSVGIRVGGPAPSAENLTIGAQRFLDSFCVNFLGDCVAAGGIWALGVTIAGCTGRVIGTDGKTVGAPIEVSPSQSPAYGFAAPSLPNQCACVVTLKTSQAGRSGTGRIYLPLLALGVVNGKHGKAGQISGAVRHWLDTAYADLGLTALGARDWCIYSAKGAGAVAKIVSVRVGDVIDTQRRRRDGLTEAYSATTLTYQQAG